MNWKKLAEKLLKERMKNSDWKDPGRLFISEHRKFNYTPNVSDKSLPFEGVFVKFEFPEREVYSKPFTGVVLVAHLDKQKKPQTGYRPVFGKPTKSSYREAAWDACKVLCEDCGHFTYKCRSSHAAGPECMVVEYRCSHCGKSELDALD